MRAVERAWDKVAGRLWEILWAADQPRGQRAEAVKALWHFFNEVEDELTHHRLAIEELRREVALLRERPIIFLDNGR